MNQILDGEKAEIGHEADFFERAVLIAAVALAGSFLQSGCAAAWGGLRPSGVASQQRDFDKQTGILIKHLKALQAKGDPLRDYCCELANSDGWLTEVTDPKAIAALFEKVAAKGSMDAKILLPLQVAMNEGRGVIWRNGGGVRRSSSLGCSSGAANGDWC